jgi:hypothetical protein
LDALVEDVGASLLTSASLARRQPLQVLALLTRDQPAEPAAATEHTRRLHTWLASLAPIPQPTVHPAGPPADIARAA